MQNVLFCQNSFYAKRVILLQMFLTKRFILSECVSRETRHSVRKCLMQNMSFCLKVFRARRNVLLYLTDIWEVAARSAS